jgi:hypothetical protein
MSALKTPLVAIVILLLCLSVTSSANAQDTALPPLPPDAGLYTSYFFGSSFQNLTWIVCGSTQQSEGCYDFGTLGPFGNVGAMLESDPITNANTVTRAIYVVDSNSNGGVQLYVYKKTDVVTASFDTTTVTLIKNIPLPLTGGSTVACSMAANKQFLFIGTNQSSQAVEVQKSNLRVSSIGGFSPPVNVTSITSNSYGYVTVTFGGFTGGESGFYQFAPNGEGAGDGGGAWFMLDTSLGLSTANLPLSRSLPEIHLGYHSKTDR